MHNARYFLVIDLEATCDDQGRIPRQDMETIELGAVLVDGDSMAPISEFQRFIKPAVHRTLTPFCRELTSIRQEDVDGAASFPEVIRDLEAWLSPRQALFGSWGAYDRGQLQQDADRYNMSIPWLSPHLNIKKEFSRMVGGKPCGMAAALEKLKLPLKGTHHRGIDDARNIARLLPYALGRKQARRPAS